MIKISNCPDTGLERFITAKDTLFYESTKQVILKCHISHFKTGVIIENARINSYTKNLVATVDTKVNPQTGAILPYNTQEPYISEYQFFLNLKSTLVKQEDIELQIIQSRDLEGKFNI